MAGQLAPMGASGTACRGGNFKGARRTPGAQRRWLGGAPGWPGTVQPTGGPCIGRGWRRRREATGVSPLDLRRLVDAAWLTRPGLSGLGVGQAGGATFVVGPALAGEVVQLAVARGLEVPAP